VRKVEPAVISISVFDPSGRRLHTGTGFYISSDGRFITDWHVVEGGLYAVAKSADGKIRNVTGVMASSPELDLAVLRAETKIGVPFLRLSKTSELDKPLAVVGSSLTRREQPLATVKISAEQTDSGGELLATSAPLSAETAGAPLINENGEVVGVTTIAKDPSGAVVVRLASGLTPLLAKITPETVAQWAGAEAESPTPSPSPKKLRVVANPAPVYPVQALHANPPLNGSGRFRIVFNASGQVKEVQIVRSTGQAILDQAAVNGLQQWKSEPGHEWSLVVPITFRP
jgi:TonB family protein